jgi:plasmid stabilization system protein ParE
MEVRWTPNARADLHAIHDYIAQDSPQNALNFIDRLTQRAEQMSDFLRSGRIVPEHERDDVRELIESPYRIIYRLLPEYIDVLAVMHGSRLLRDIPGLPAH